MESKAPEEVTVEKLAGVEEGTVLPTPENQPDEKVVADYDENGNIVGWHKEVVSKEKE